ncbi:lipoprotein-releasing ABC transporter permease subunit LolC [Thaumasiovibrio subtropicus]|uniref:lipoprotein-releasing ABC transporter permease subunit LolC n=1 Tax=Thaumasiovibrio subtropicus TaxID=1891207 RepID=UPI000B34E7AC|nr:lipoprotein-releasing ABC transporter permease subunit LolC [Thaumasiovibrio subtropicus]
MFRSVPLFIGWRYLRGRSGDKFSRFVSYMSMAGITIGVMALITVLSVMNGFEQQLKGRLLGVLPHALVSAEAPVSGDAPAHYLEHPSVYRITPLSRSEAVVQSAESLSAINLMGIDPEGYEPLAMHLINGKISDLEAGEYQIILGRGLANDLGVRLGDKVRVMVTSVSQFTPLGRVPSQRNFTVTGLYSSLTDVDSQVALVHIRDAGRLLRYQDGTFTGWRLYIDDPFNVPALEKDFAEDDLLWSDWRQQRGELFQAVKMEKNMMSLMLGLIIAVAAFNIISSLIMVVMEKQSEVAILKTQGMGQKQIQAIFMFQGAISGFIGSVLGVALGIVLALNLNTLLTTIGATTLLVGGHLPVLIQPAQILTVFIFSILLSFGATLLPAYRAAQLKPAETLRYE